MQYAYNGSSELTKTTYGDGGEVAYGYATDGSATGSRAVTKITDKGGNDITLTWTYGLNAQSAYEAYKVSVANPAGLTTVLERSLSTSVCTTRNWDGMTLIAKFVNTPLGSNYALSQYKDYYTDANNYLRWTYGYDAGNDLTMVSAPGGVVLEKYTYTSDGKMASYTKGASGPSEHYEYGANGGMTKSFNFLGLATTYYYDSAGRVTRSTDPSYTHSTLLSTDGSFAEYGANGLVTKTKDAQGNAWTYAYDSLGRLTQSETPAGVTSSQWYDDLGSVVTKRLKLSATSNADTYFEYAPAGCGCGGASGKLTKVRDALNNATTFEYDDNGSMITMTDALNRSTAYAYDAMLRMTKTTRADGAYSTVEYDLLGRTTKTTDADGRETTFGYDFLGRMTQQTDAVGSVSYTYTSLGAVSTVTDGNGRTTDYDYTDLGYLTKVTDALGKQTQYFYDSYLRQTKVAAGATGTFHPTEYYFDAATGQMTQVQMTSDIAQSVYYRFDYSGQMTQVDESWVNCAPGGASNLGHFFERDHDGRLTKYRDYDDDPAGTRKMLQYTYDAAGRVSMMTDYEGFDTVYRYTDAGQVAAITAAGSKIWDYGYNALGQPTKVTLPNGMTANYSYDGANRMTKLEHKDGATVKLGFTYGLTAGGQITRITHQDSAYWAYGNDGRGRLTRAERYTAGNALQLKETYSYDAGDNLLTKVQYDQRPAPAVTKNTWYRYNAGNELTKMTVAGVDTNMTYDDWGRLITKTQGAYTAAYLWRYGGKLYSATTNFPGEAGAVYEYRGDGRQYSRTSGGTTTRYNWDAGWNMLGEDDASGNLLTSFVAANPMAQVAGTLAELAGSNPATGTAKCYFKDHLGSTVGVYGQDNTLLASTWYEPYGGQWFTNGAQPRFTFTGKPYDAATGMYYFPYRYYAPDRARWVSRDPLGMVDGPNLYGYVRSNPVLLSDPQGLQAACISIGWGCALAEPTPIGECVMTCVSLAVGICELVEKCTTDPCERATPVDCVAIYEKDKNVCRDKTAPQRKKACYDQAMQRFAQCTLTGQPPTIPFPYP